MGDAVSFVLEPGAFVEYKYRIAPGASMLCSWRATTAVEYDFHTEPQNAASSEPISFETGTADARLGSYVAPLTSGRWDNRPPQPAPQCFPS